MRCLRRVVWRGLQVPWAQGHFPLPARQPSRLPTPTRHPQLKLPRRLRARPRPAGDVTSTRPGVTAPAPLLKGGIGKNMLERGGGEKLASVLPLTPPLSRRPCRFFFRVACFSPHALGWFVLARSLLPVCRAPPRLKASLCSTTTTTVPRQRLARRRAAAVARTAAAGGSAAGTA